LWGVAMASRKRKASAPTTSKRDASVILVDMDDTIADFTGRALALLSMKYPDLVLPKKEVTSFPLANSFDPADKAKVTALFLQEGYFRDMEPLPGAVAALHQMVDAGYNVRLCSAPLSSSPKCLAEKAEWVQRWLGHRWIDRLILTRDKTLVHGALLIDDAPTAKGESLTPTWQHVYFARPHNRPGAPGADPERLRLVSWADWADVVPLALERANVRRCTSES